MNKGSRAIGALVLLMAGAALLAGCKGANETQPDVLVTVNGEPVKNRDLQTAWNLLPDEDKQNYAGVNGARKLLDEVITWRLMAQEAQKRHLDEDPSVKERLDFARQQVLVNALLEKAASDADVYRYYQENFVRARFIFLAFPENAGAKQKAKIKDSAQKVFEELKGGADFRELAQKYSNADNAVSGGEMGYVTQETIQSMAGFKAAEALFALKDPDQFSGPVESDKGYYIFQLVEPSGSLDPRGLSPKLRESLRDIKREEIIRSYANELKTSTENEVVFNDNAVKDLLLTVQKAMQENMAGDTAEPTPSPEPGESVQPEPEPGQSVEPSPEPGESVEPVSPEPGTSVEQGESP
jgi:peptidyl-prolyl cis-trans isomerase C